MTSRYSRRGINVVGRTNSSQHPTAPGIIHLTHGDLYADIVRDRRDRELWLYVIQREGSTEVLAMGSCLGEEPARVLAMKIMRDLAATGADATAATAV